MVKSLESEISDQMWVKKILWIKPMRSSVTEEMENFHAVCNITQKKHVIDRKDELLKKLQRET